MLDRTEEIKKFKTQKVVVEDYNPEWPVEFERLKRVFEKRLKGLYRDIQHIGSTSVPGLAAKPVIDLDIIIDDIAYLCPLATRLNEMGYRHLGDLGIVGREAFGRETALTPDDGSGYLWKPHNLYVCINGAIGLRNHLALRDYLRRNPDKAEAYGKLKKQLAEKYPDDIDSYIENKTPFITAVLREMGFDQNDLQDITQQNEAN